VLISYCDIMIVGSIAFMLGGLFFYAVIFGLVGWGIYSLYKKITKNDPKKY